MKTLLALGMIVLGPAVLGSDKAEVVLLCEQNITAVDGDTISCDGRMLRDMGRGEPFVDGYDAPEITYPKCAKEKRLGLLAKERMEELLNDQAGVQLVYSGIDDAFGRGLIWAYRMGGKPLGEILIEEGLAHYWRYGVPKQSWCK